MCYHLTFINCVIFLYYFSVKYCLDSYLSNTIFSYLNFKVTPLYIFQRFTIQIHSVQDIYISDKMLFQHNIIPEFYHSFEISLFHWNNSYQSNIFLNNTVPEKFFPYLYATLESYNENCDF